MVQIWCSFELEVDATSTSATRAFAGVEGTQSHGESIEHVFPARSSSTFWSDLLVEQISIWRARQI